MNAAIPAYSQDVATLTDEELQALSAEMEEAYVVRGYDGDSEWTDDEAETRHREMQAELRRRHPREPGPLDAVMDFYCGEAARSIGRSIEIARAMDAEFMAGDRWPVKMGDTITVRKPLRFRS